MDSSKTPHTSSSWMSYWAFFKALWRKDTVRYLECIVLHQYFISCNGLLSSESDFRFACNLVPKYCVEFILQINSCYQTGCWRFKRYVYELLNLRALEISVLHINCIVFNACECHLKFYTNILPIHWKMYILFTPVCLTALRFKSL